jgi:hypothetical protein
VDGGEWMMMMIYYSCVTLSDYDEIIYSPVPYAIRPDLGQPAGGTWRLPLPRWPIPTWRRVDGGELLVTSSWQRVNGGDWMAATAWQPVQGGEWMAGSGWQSVDGGQ